MTVKLSVWQLQLVIDGGNFLLKTPVCPGVLEREREREREKERYFNLKQQSETDWSN